MRLQRGAATAAGREDQVGWLTHLPARNIQLTMGRQARFLAALWTGCLAASLAWNLHEQRERTVELARISAQVSFDNDLLYRRWAAHQGGVYVPVSEHTAPNPYLNVPDRDVTTTSGLSLTLLNPAYMVRQVNQLAQQGRGSRGHLTSLKPLRPENAPDSFERAALTSFETGIKEVSALESKDGLQDLRLMRPLLVEKPCLKCHVQQGYKEGDIRGGISVSVPMEPILAIEGPQGARTSIAHGLVWLLGVVGLTLWGRGLEKQISARERAEQAAMHHAAELEAVFAAMTHGIMVYDAAGSMVRANAAARALYDIDPIGVDIETLAKRLSSRRLERASHRPRGAAHRSRTEGRAGSRRAICSHPVGRTGDGRVVFVRSLAVGRSGYRSGHGLDRHHRPDSNPGGAARG